MPPAAWWPPGRPRWGWRGCGCGSPRRCAPCAPLLASATHFTARQSSRKARADHQAMWAGAWWAGSVRARGPGVMGGGGGHGAAVVGVAAPGGAEAAVAGPGGGGCVLAAGVRGGSVGLVGGGGRGHGPAVACLAASGRAGAAVAAAGGEKRERCGERDARCCS